MQHFFQPYDCYEGRIFEIWELCIIFEEKVPEQVFWELAGENQKIAPLKAGVIEYKFLANELELSKRLQLTTIRQAPAKKSVYESKFTGASDKLKKLF